MTSAVFWRVILNLTDRTNFLYAATFDLQPRFSMYAPLRTCKSLPAFKMAEGFASPVNSEYGETCTESE